MESRKNKLAQDELKQATVELQDGNEIYEENIIPQQLGDETSSGLSVKKYLSERIYFCRI